MIADMPLLIVSRAVILCFFHISKSMQLDIMKSTMLERLMSRLAAFLSTASTIFCGSEPNVQAWSDVHNLSRVELKIIDWRDKRRRSSESFT